MKTNKYIGTKKSIEYFISKYITYSINKPKALGMNNINHWISDVGVSLERRINFQTFGIKLYKEIKNE